MRLYREGDNSPLEVYNPKGAWGLFHPASLHWMGRSLIQITCIDISDRKRIETELRLSTKEYGAVARQSTSGIMRYDIATGAAIVNVDSCLNRVEEYTIPNYVKVVRNSGMVDPHSMPTARSMFRDICGGAPSIGYDLLLTLPQGEQRWCHLDYVLIRDDQGKPYRAVVSFRDNTEQRERELAYQRWNTRLSTLMNEYTSYMEVNLTRDVIEAEGRSGSWNQLMKGRCYGDFMQQMELDEIFVDDRLPFQKFFNRERLLGQFLAGDSEGSLEYRVLGEGEPQWHRADLQMVSDPVTGEIKASIMFSNVDTALKEQKRLKTQAEQDVMTGLYNHAAAERLISQALSQDTGEGCCFLVIDLDDLRDINSFLGHPEGDRALKAIAGAMRTHFGESSILGRIGGDEFVAFLQSSPEIDQLRAMLTAFMRSLNETNIGPMNNRPIQVSVGAALGTIGTEDFQTLYERADLALFYTKAVGKNSFHLYHPDLENRSFLYQPRSTVTLSNRNWFDSSEFKKLLKAMSAFFPLVISVNLTKNTYYMMEYTAYTTQKAQDEGSFDQLIADGVSTFHPDDRESFTKSFSRENLLKAYREGKKIVEHKGRQLGDDGIYRFVKTIVFFMKDEYTGDICELTFTRVTSSEAD